METATLYISRGAFAPTSPPASARCTVGLLFPVTAGMLQFLPAP